MKSVLLRHFPELTGAMADIKNAFRPWKRVALTKGDHRKTKDECLDWVPKSERPKEIKGRRLKK